MTSVIARTCGRRGSGCGSGRRGGSSMPDQPFGRRVGHAGGGRIVGLPSIGIADLVLLSPARLFARTKGMAMRLGRSWDVPDEFWLLWWRSRELRTLIMRADVEPAGKGPAGRRSAPEFQRQAMDQMERYGRYPMTGPVALDLHFRAARRNPPGIHRAAKHTLDILGPALPGCERPRRRSVLQGRPAGQVPVRRPGPELAAGRRRERTQRFSVHCRPAGWRCDR